jgi:hypothetical protein
MTANITRNIKKVMGWCPNVNALATKRVMVALPEGEDFFTDEKGKIGSNPVKLKWGNKYRNLMLVGTIMGLAVFAFSILLIGRDYAEFMTKDFLKINHFSVIFGVFILYIQWRDLNRINERKPRSAKTEIVFSALLLLLGAISIYSAIMGITIYLDLILIYLTGSIISFPFLYPMVIYWEWKNKKTIYLVEKESRGWRPVALPDRVS